MNVFQQSVMIWLRSCFPKQICDSAEERNFRFLEEALELVQSNSMRKEQVLALVEYVYDRPLGDPFQEVGGVMITLSSLCEQANIQIGDAAQTEFDRINRPVVMNSIRKKWDEKSKRGLGI